VFDETLRSSQAVVGMRAIGYLDVEWGEDNMAAIEKGWVLSGSTIEELGREIRDHSENRSLMNPERLVETVDVYNSYCDRGVDEEFDSDPVNMGPLREPPFYAIPLYPGGPNTKGGIMTNERREVLDMDGEPIPNLFSAGEISSAFKFVYQGGGNIAECIVFGRVAGENAVTNARGHNRQDTFELTR
jgi:succinate dehydrogenase/fumarate reductase flavoprotein subunit